MIFYQTWIEKTLDLPINTAELARNRRAQQRATGLTREGKKACAMVSFSTLSLREKVPGAPADRKQFCTFSCPRLATTTLGEHELSGMRITGAPASMSSKTLDAR